jgi:hypothetical protein
MDCGFTTNTYYLAGSTEVEHLKKSIPSLYRDLLFEDKEGLIWMPSTMAVTGRGTIFIHGSNIINWQWCFAPDVELNEEEKAKKKYSGMKYKTDMSQAQYFGQRDFVLAMIAGEFIKLK